MISIQRRVPLLADNPLVIESGTWTATNLTENVLVSAHVCEPRDGGANT